MLDCNSMYPFAMQQHPPLEDCAWSLSNASLEEILVTHDDAAVGYKCEVDLHVPEELPDYLADLPPCPELASIEASPCTAAQRQRLGRKADTAPIADG